MSYVIPPATDSAPEKAAPKLTPGTPLSALFFDEGLDVIPLERLGDDDDEPIPDTVPAPPLAP